MGELIFLLLLGWLFSTVKTSKGKTQKRKMSEALRQMMQTAKTAEPAQRTQPKAKPQPEAKPQHVAKPTKAPVAISQHHEPLAEGESHLVQTTFQQAAEYVGSLHTTSTEGEDICDPALGHEGSEQAYEIGSVYAEPISASSPLDFSAQGLYQGIVMSEILKRPACRMRPRP